MSAIFISSCFKVMGQQRPPVSELDQTTILMFIYSYEQSEGDQVVIDFLCLSLMCQQLSAVTDQKDFQ